MIMFTAPEGMDEQSEPAASDADRLRWRASTEDGWTSEWLRPP